MAEIYMNDSILKDVIESYSDIDGSFVLRSFTGDDKKKRCICFINGNECKIDFYITKKGTVKILPTGNRLSIDDSNCIIEYVCSKGMDAKIDTKQFAFPCNRNTVDLLVSYIEKEFSSLVSVANNGNIYKFKGYNHDEITFSFFPSTNKAMIQGKPLQVYNIVITYLSMFTELPFDIIVDINNEFHGTTLTLTSIRDEMKNKLGKAYDYLDEALLKSLSGSFSALKEKNIKEDYKGCILGVFITIEGYLSKILVRKFNYTISKNPKFPMFYKENGNSSEIDNDTNIELECKKHLIRLYRLYSNKRNVYLHATVDPANTPIISTLSEAQNIADEILEEISASYTVFFK